jgi:hypothetical protein
MNTEQERGEPERREGLGGRVRRFIDSEVNRALDKRDHGTEKVDTDPRGAPNKATDLDQPQEPVTVPPEPVTPYDEQPARPVHVPPAPVDSPVHGSATDVSSAHSSRSPAYDRSVEGASSGQIGGRSREEAAADSSAERVGLLDDPAGLRDQWEQVQGTFVDDPQRAVHEASVLVERTLQEIHRNVTRGQTTNPTSTEDLRVSFQRYREFFQRLLSA